MSSEGNVWTLSQAFLLEILTPWSFLWAHARHWEPLEPIQVERKRQILKEEQVTYSMSFVIPVEAFRHAGRYGQDKISYECQRRQVPETKGPIVSRLCLPLVWCQYLHSTTPPPTPPPPLLPSGLKVLSVPLFRVDPIITVDMQSFLFTDKTCTWTALDRFDEFIKCAI